MADTRQYFLEGLQAVRTLWSGQPVDRAEEMFADAVRLSASHRGETAGRARVIDALRTDFAGLELDYLGFNNRVARAEDRAGLVSAYFHGWTRNPAALDQQVMFGGLVIVSFDIEGMRSHISGIKAQLTWTKGHPRFSAAGAYPRPSGTGNAATCRPSSSASWIPPGTAFPDRTSS